MDMKLKDLLLTLPDNQQIIIKMNMCFEPSFYIYKGLVKDIPYNIYREHFLMLVSRIEANLSDNKKDKALHIYIDWE